MVQISTPLVSCHYCFSYVTQVTYVQTTLKHSRPVVLWLQMTCQNTL